jgi:signal transduction histidine kinase
MERRDTKTGRPAAVALMELALSCDLAAPRLARNAFDLVQGLDGVREDALLVMSELVSNAVRHSGGGVGDVIRVDASERDGLLTLSVTDPGTSGATPRLRPHAPDESGGLGLSIVAKLSSRWGTERTAGDRCLVWAELAIHD